VNWSLKAIGVDGTIEITRGGWNGSRDRYTLTWKKGSEETQTKQFPFVGVDREFQCFVDQVSFDAKLDTLSSTPSSDKSLVKLFKVLSHGQEDVRGSPEEGARDLALIEALLASGGEMVDVVPIV
jgi:hypothetical protein